MGDNTFRYDKGAPRARVRGTGETAQKAAASAGAREPGGFQRATALAGRAMAGRGEVRGHGGYASALLDRIPAARRPQGEDGGAPGAPSSTYWRRRFVILAISLALLGTASWSLSQALKVPPAPLRHSAGRHRGGGGARTAPPATSPGHGTSQAATGGASPSQGHTATSSPRARHQPSPQPSAKTSGFRGFKPAFCSWHSIVLSLSAAQAHYGPGQQPNFSLSVVSTQPKPCSFNIGPSHLALVIKEGSTRIWSSADCVAGSGNLVTALHRGVPTLVTIAWKRKTSSPACSGPTTLVPPGTYTGYAVDGSLTSPPVPIRLS